MAQRTASTKTAALVAAGVAAAGAAAIVATRARGRGHGAARGLRRGSAAPEPAATVWTCVCGEAYRSVGVGRHQVHWRADAPEGEPLLRDTCPSCERLLAVGAEAAAPARA
jgi:hypothetical protein